MSKQNLPLVSIAIITYNSAKFIAKAMDSALAQDYPNIEIIVSDDASTDATPKIIQTYIDLYPDKIKLLTLSQNVGITKNWFNCVAYCKGKYITGLAGDDIMLSNKVSTQVSVMESDPNIAICYSDAVVVNAATQKILYRLSDKAPSKSGGIKTALSDSIYYSPTLMFRKEFLPLQNIYLDIRHATDLAFHKEVMILSAPNGKIQYLPQVLYIYNKHQYNLTVITKSYYKEHIEAIKTLQKRYPQYKRDLDPSIADFCCVALFKTLRELNLRQTGYFLSVGLKASKGNPLKFLRPTIWALQFYYKFKKRQLNGQEITQVEL